MTKTTPRIPLLVAGGLAALLATALLIAGGALLWADGKKDADGYLSSDVERFATPTAALATENLDVDLDGAEELGDDFGAIRLRAESRNGEPVFVGVARTSDVEAYLGGVAHTVVDDLSFEPFRADYRDRTGARTATPPASRDIWAASAQGTGVQALDWDVADGDWSVVVMNADGSPGVSADINAGAKLPFLDDIGWSVLGGGAFTVLLAGGLVLLAFRRPRRGPGLGEPLPAAA